MTLKTLALSLFVALAAALPARAAFETSADAAYVYDLTTDTVLLDKKGDVPLPPASMSKLMTLDLLFEALRDGRVTMETEFPVSDHAASMGGSTMFLDQRDRPKVEDLIQGIVVQSGNDACVVVAEGLAGTEEAFARLMNERAEALGLTNSTFANASGWPDPNQRMSMHDLVKLASRLITVFPEYYGYFGEKEYVYDGRAPQNRFNRNPLLELGIGADGLKTGHTSEAGYGLVGSAKQGDRRIVFAISGLDSEQARSEEAESIVNWAFRQYVERTVAEAGTRMTEAPVWLGEAQSVGIVTAKDLTLLVPATQREALKAEIVYTSPIVAPIEKGQQLAELIVSFEGLPDKHVPLVAEEAVPRGGFLPQVRTAATVLMRDLIGEARALR